MTISFCLIRNGTPTELCILPADSVGEKDDPAAIEGAATVRQLEETSFYEQTTVEVCVKVVVCRKFITKKVDAKTGKVVHTSVRMVMSSLSYGPLPL